MRVLPSMNKVREAIEKHDCRMSEEGFGIYRRSQVVTSILLTYCSPLKFYFQGRLLPRGWLDVLILGDTRCGKSVLAEGILNKLQMGQLICCEGASFVGLVGGLQQLSSRSKWNIIWGKIPLNSGKLVVLDELSSYPVEEIGKMSGLRSSGIAEISKVESGMTRAATRLIWISNPRNDMKLNQFVYGVEAVRELIGRPEDIARFDFVLAIREEDVSKEITNQKKDLKAVDLQWENLRELVMWAWQLRPADVIFEARNLLPHLLSY